MKKLVFAVIAALSLGAFVACKNGGLSTAGGEQYVDSSVLAFDSIVINDSVTVGSTGKVWFVLNCVYPVAGEQVLVDSINAWLGSLICYNNEEGDEVAVPGKTVKEKCVNYASVLLKENEKGVNAEIEDMAEYAEGSDDMYVVNYEDELNVSVLYEDSCYVTLFVSDYTYRNGAHASCVVYGVTFSKKDGHRCGDELLRNYTQRELQSLMLQGLKKHFLEGSDATLNELVECVDIAKEDMLGNIPMPSTSPYLDEDGIHLIYQQYEIAPYAAGTPEIVIPVK